MKNLAKIIFIVLLLLFIPALAMADTIYLTDGSVIVGDIINITNDTIMVKTDMGILEINKSNIEKIIFEIVPDSDEEREKIKNELEKMKDEGDSNIDIVFKKDGEEVAEEETEEEAEEEEEETEEEAEEEEETEEDNENNDYEWENEDENNNYNNENNNNNEHYWNNEGKKNTFNVFNGAGGGSEVGMYSGTNFFGLLEGSRGYADLFEFLRIGGFSYSSYILGDPTYRKDRFGGPTIGLFTNYNKSTFSVSLDIGFGTGFYTTPRIDWEYALLPFMRLGLYGGYLYEYIGNTGFIFFGVGVKFGIFPENF
ncbi:MAG: hypothetical protein ACOCV8_00605 [Spirochaetota bacterium]